MLNVSVSRCWWCCWNEKFHLHSVKSNSILSILSSVDYWTGFRRRRRLNWFSVAYSVSFSRPSITRKIKDVNKTFASLVRLVERESSWTLTHIIRRDAMVLLLAIFLNKISDPVCSERNFNLWNKLPHCLLVLGSFDCSHLVIVFQKSCSLCFILVISNPIVKRMDEKKSFTRSPMVCPHNG